MAGILEEGVTDDGDAYWCWQTDLGKTCLAEHELVAIDDGSEGFIEEVTIASDGNIIIRVYSRRIGDADLPDCYIYPSQIVG